jgi:fructokinase
MQQQPVICFGETLWDLFPAGKVAGGAPMNVAVHLRQLGIDATMISRVGKDKNGEEILEFLRKKGVPVNGIQTDPIHSTGEVKVMLNEKGYPTYEIVENVAWDYIQTGIETEALFEKGSVLVFGSLASRNAVSFNALRQLLPMASLRVFDVNLRRPYYSKELVDFLLQRAEIVKMNDEELEEITGWFRPSEDERSNMQFMRKKYGLEILIITKGEHGACAIDDRGYLYQKGFSVNVRDTVGSGDSFLAAFLSKYLTGESMQECLAFAGAIGAFVATREGGTPSIDPEEVQAIMNQELLH